MTETRHIGFDLANRFALYIEGELCPFEQIDRHREVNSIPTMVVSLPATEYVRRLRMRSRVHLLFLDHRNTWRVIFEGEILAKGFSKETASRSFQFVVSHVSGLLDQFAVSALEPAAMPDAMMAGRGPDGGSTHNDANVVSLKGSVMELLQPKEVAKELAQDPGFQKPKGGDVSLSYWIKGSFRRYIRIVRNSRIANSYINKAVVFHRLMDRIAAPMQDALNWDSFYSHLLAELFTESASRVGERQTFFEMVRTLVTNFLYEIVIEPGSRTYQRQIQVRPNTIFNAIPSCNVLYPSLVGNYGYQEDPATKPTRTEAHFRPLSSLAGIEGAAAIYKAMTVFGPAELQWKWNIVQGVKEPLVTTNIDVNQLLGEIKPPDPQFLTQEEEERGVVPNYFDTPSMLLAAIMKLGAPLGGKSYSGSSKASISGSDQEIRMEAAVTALSKNDPANRRHKYMALMALALGEAGGINQSAMGGKELKAKYRLKDKQGQLFDFSDTFYNRIGANGQHAIPRRIVLIGATDKPKIEGSTVTNAEAIARSTGANYLIAKDGTIIQLRGRNILTWDEPQAIPIGLKCTFSDGIGGREGINSLMPHVGGTKRAKLGKFKSLTGTFKFVSAVPGPAVTMGTELDLGRQEVKLEGAPSDLGSLMMTLSPGAVSLKIEVPNGEGKYTTYESVPFTVVQGTNGKPKLVLGKPLVPTYSPTAGPAMKDTKITLGGSTQGGYPHQPFWLVADNVQAPKLQTNNSPSPDTVNPWAEMTFQSYFKDKTQIAEFATHYKRSYVAGNFGSLVIAFELDRIGAVPNGKQLDAAAYLSAAVVETTVEEGFEKPRAINGVGTWAEGRLISEIEPIQSYLGSGTYWDVGGIGANFYKQVDAYRAAFYTDFETINKELTGEDAPAIAIAAKATADDNTDPPAVDNSAQADEPEEAEVKSDKEASEAKAPTVSLTFDMTNALKRYAAPIVNYQHHYARFMNQQTSIGGMFNPYPVIGFPCLMPDNTAAATHLVGYLHAVHDTISGKGQAQTSYTVTHIRPFNDNDEALIPFSVPYTQHYRIREILNPKAATSQAIKTALGEFGNPKDKGYLGKQVTHLPIQLFGIGIKDEDRNPVPFIYDSGFGLMVKDGKGKIDFSEYARFAGVGDAKGEQWKNALLFRNSALRTDVTPSSAFGTSATPGYSYREIQKVGDTAEAASLVEFDGAAKGLHPEKPPQRITLRAVNPVTLKEETLKWNATIRELVSQHRAAIENHLGLPG